MAKPWNELNQSEHPAECQEQDPLRGELRFDVHHPACESQAEQGQEGDAGEVPPLYGTPLLIRGREAQPAEEGAQVEGQHTADGAAQHPTGREIQNPQAQRGSQEQNAQRGISKPLPAPPDGKQPDATEKDHPARKWQQPGLCISPCQ